MHKTYEWRGVAEWQSIDIGEEYELKDADYEEDGCEMHW